ncbi:hypothetical protein P7D79_04775 [Enterococcus avium]|uniref:Phage tail tape measure protein n=1 Tax=Enterococcus avium TaxID=33945 RepID=A0ABD5F7J0_ENTAV|nr:hypothetical protein [Enterococcus avium]MDT2513535.1 hypothetical protein [Enterococcus avium]MDT2513547.1 hypothetical protein [Enterococcus avium]
MRNLLSWQTSAKAQLNQLSGIKSDISSLKSWKITHDSWAGTQASRISTLEGWRTTQTSTSGKHGSRIGALEDWKKVHDAWAGKQADRIGALESWKNGHDTWAGKLKEKVDSNTSSINSLLSWKDTHDAWTGKLKEKVDSNTSSINGLSSWKVAHDEFASNLVKRMDTHDDWAGKQAGKLTTLEKRVSELSSGFSDVAIIASINLQGKNNTDLWNAEHYDGGSINENDGKAVKLFKIQFQGLKTHISSMLKTYFGEDGIYTKLMQKPLNRIIDLLELIEDKEIKVGIPDLTDNFTRLMTLLNTLLGLIKDNHQVIQDLGLKEPSTRIIELLEAIRDKELTVEIPPFEISEIKNMPDVNLSENGNGWLKTLIKTIGDILKTAIETLGSVLETAIGEVGALLRDLLAFLEGLIDDLLRLVVPENLDFMDHKFDSTSKTIKLKFGSIFDGIDAFKGMFGSKSVFKDIEINLGKFGNGSFKLPVSVLNDMAPFVKALITGAVALEFLIDMYKWFHTKGEVIE